MAVFEEDEKKKQEEEAAKKAEEDKARETEKAQLTELQKQLEASNAELSKLRDKDFNFKRLKDMTDEEKDRLTEKEMELQKRQEALEDATKDFQTKELGYHRRDVISRLTGGNEEDKKAVEEAWSNIVGDDASKEDIEKKAAKVWRFVQGGKSNASPNPLGAAMSFGGSAPVKADKKSYTETEEGKDMAKALGIQI